MIKRLSLDEDRWEDRITVISHMMLRAELEASEDLMNETK